MKIYCLPFLFFARNAFFLLRLFAFGPQIQRNRFFSSIAQEQIHCQRVWFGSWCSCPNWEWRKSVALGRCWLLSLIDVDSMLVSSSSFSFTLSHSTPSRPIQADFKRSIQLFHASMQQMLCGANCSLSHCTQFGKIWPNLWRRTSLVRKWSIDTATKLKE